MAAELADMGQVPASEAAAHRSRQPSALRDASYGEEDACCCDCYRKLAAGTVDDSGETAHVGNQ